MGFAGAATRGSPTIESAIEWGSVSRQAGDDIRLCPLTARFDRG